MSGFFVVFVVIAMVATLGVLIVGVLGMATGGEFNRRYANKLMRARVLLQALALLLFAILILLIGRG
ncbi:MAG: twin transmembrane helix small protein [Alphaproteobacteria bacterium]|nr:twin transmembrane helix small protein [Alphaproteobacteria bacterium]